MINIYSINQPSISLESDLAGEFPLYLYLSDDNKMLMFSKNIIELLSDPRVSKPLKICNKGISFLLQSAVIPPPKTVYKNVYILGIGDTVEVKTVNKVIKLRFTHSFPFMNANRSIEKGAEFEDSVFLQMLAQATIQCIDQSNPSFLFHSAGKDSNSVALALAEAGWQDKVTLITHKSKGDKDESVISKKIANQLGFKHQVLNEVDRLGSEHKQEIEDYFINSPFPCTDNVTLAYPLYAQQLPELKKANIIDGGGNDCYMGTPLDKWEEQRYFLAKKMSFFSVFRKVVNSESLFNPLLRTPAEWCGPSGFSFKDTRLLFSNASSTYAHWKFESNKRANWELYDFKSDILTTIIASEVHIRKVRNFADSISSKIILPFANSSVAAYFAKMPEEYLVDRKEFKNKLILRTLLKKHIDLDSDAIGKMGFSYDSRTVLLQNWEYFIQEIHECLLWDPLYLTKFLTRMRCSMNKSGWQAKSACNWVYRLYLVSAWVNRNKYVSEI